MPPSEMPPVIPRRRSNRWIWFFVILALLASTAVVIPFFVNLWPQLKPEQLQSARQLWEEKGPASYDMTYTKSGSVVGVFRVEVRQGKVQRVVELQSLTDEVGRDLEPRQFEYYGMTAMFDDMETFLEMKQKEPGSRKALRAWFDDKDGHIRSYIYSDPAGRQQIKVSVDKFEPR